MNPQAIFKELTPRARIGLGVAAVGFLAVTFFLLKLATAPAYSTVMTGIQPNQSDKITQALADRGVSYQLQNNGTALAVEKSQLGEARVALATAGVNAGSGTSPASNSSTSKARLLRLPAARHLPARARGRDREHDRPDQRRQRRAGAAHAPGGQAVLQRVDARDGLGAALRHLEPRWRAGARHREPRRRQRAGPLADKVTITDGSGQLLWPTDGSSGGSASARSPRRPATTPRWRVASTTCSPARSGRTRRASRSPPI